MFRTNKMTLTTKKLWKITLEMQVCSILNSFHIFKPGFLFFTYSVKKFKFMPSNCKSSISEHSGPHQTCAFVSLFVWAMHVVVDKFSAKISFLLQWYDMQSLKSNLCNKYDFYSLKSIWNWHAWNINQVFFNFSTPSSVFLIFIQHLDSKMSSDKCGKY